jgi:hypothetical protein
MVACVFVTAVKFLPSRCLAKIAGILPSRCVATIGGIFTEPLPSNDKGIFTEPLPINDRGIFAEPLPSNNKGGCTHRQQRYRISLLLFFQNKESRLKTS